MPRLRPRLLALVVALPLLLLAFVGWFIADDPLVELRDWGVGVGNTTPAWQVADVVINACLPIVALALILAAVVVAVRRARRQRSWAAAGNVIAAAVVVVSAAAAFFGHASHPDSSAAPYFLALVLGLLVGIGVLANAAWRAQSDRRTARLVVLPAAILGIVSLATFVALVVYAADLIINGAPIVGPDRGAHVYPIDALPAGHTDWLPALIVSVAASLAALCYVAYALIALVRGAQTKAAPAEDIVIELDVASS
jgi:hypothetical protein